MVQDAVAAQVTVAFLRARDGRRQAELAARGVEESLRSLDLNMRRIRGAKGFPIEALRTIQAAAAARAACASAAGEPNHLQFLLLHAVAGRVEP